MKKVVLLLLLLMFVTSCQPKPSFPDTFNRVNELDEKYQGSFTKEKVNGTFVVGMADIPRYIADLESIKSKISRSDASDKNASLSFIRGRIDMLKAESSWHTASILGSKRQIKDAVWCGEADLVKSHSDYMEETVAEALNATLHLDDLIALYPQYRDLVGYNENKTDFYYSPTCWIGHYARVQLDALNIVCFNKSANATSRTMVELRKPACITP